MQSTFPRDENVMSRVLRKSKDVLRPDRSEYFNSKVVFQDDKEQLDSLEELELLPQVHDGSSTNKEQAIINKLINKAFSTNNPADSKEALRAILNAEAKQKKEQEKAERQLKPEATAEEKATREALAQEKKDAKNAARRAATAKKREDKKQEKSNQQMSQAEKATEQTAQAGILY
jgi:hypothetical protein